MEKKKIVVAIDGSDYSEKIIDQAIAHCKLVKATVLLVYCHRNFSTLVGQPARDREVPLITRESERLIAPYAQRLREEGIEVEERLMEEPAGAAISDVAAIEKCDLIIMGSRGLTNLAGLLIGSVTNRVLHTAPCSVLVVK